MNPTFLAGLQTLSSPQMLMAGSEPYGDSVRLRKRKPGEARPSYLYVIYIGFDNHGLVFRHIEGAIDPNNIEAEEDALIAAAKTAAIQNGSNYELLIFQQVTNVTIVLDVDDWAFYYPDSSDPEPPFAETHDPIVFNSEKSFVDDATDSIVTWPVTRNRAFYDLEPVTKTINGVRRNGIRFINHFTKNDAGDMIGAETLNYTFSLFIRGPFSTVDPSRKVTIIIDPDGQNQGPPVVAVQAPVVSAENAAVLDLEVA